MGEKREKTAGRANVFSLSNDQLGQLECKGKCRHMLNGLVDYKMCVHNYNCIKCPFDQMIADGIMMSTHTPPLATRAQLAA